jgi:ribonuclease BN (tRNA processing enzyme)
MKLDYVICTLALALPIVLAVPRSVAAQKRINRSHTGLELLVLGSGGPRSFGRASTSYLVLVDGMPRVLVDAGPGAFLEMGKFGIDFSKMDIVLLTHLHIDHSSDIPAVFLERALTADAPIQFRVFGPQGGGLFPGTSQFMQLLFGKGGAFEYEKTFGADQSIDTKDLPTNLNSLETEIVSDSGLHVKTIATHHGDCPSVAYRIEYQNRSITFAGDMDASALKNLEHLAQDTDLLVAHVGVLDAPGSPAILYTLHTPPKQIGEAAQIARARRLLLSHISPSIEQNQQQVLRSISASYKGTIKFAVDGMRLIAANTAEPSKVKQAAATKTK